jgi:hypothetical protein
MKDCAARSDCGETTRLSVENTFTLTTPSTTITVGVAASRLPLIQKYNYIVWIKRPS